MKITPARVVAFLTPVFTATAAVGTGWLSKHFPGLPHIDKAQFVVLEAAGATAALTAALKFLHGQSLWERDVLHVESYTKAVAGSVDRADPGVVARTETGAEAAATGLVDAAAAAIAPPTEWPAPPVAPEVPPIVTVTPLAT
jgi:hypothetical protein